MIILLLSLSFFISGCSTVDLAQMTPTETPSNSTPTRENLLDQADQHFNKKNYAAAKEIYIKLTYIPDHENDIIYNQALWKLSKIYEKNNQFEKAILAQEELSNRENVQISPSVIKISLIRNHYRVQNRLQAEEIERQLAADYRAQNISLVLLASELLDVTQELTESQSIDDILFMGTIQKYFIYVMENPTSPQTSALLERMKTSYDHFFALLNNKKNSARFNKKLSVTIYDQLVKFEKFKLESINSSAEAIQSFTDYADLKKKYLVERFNK